MVSVEIVQASPTISNIDQTSSPRISFSSEFLDESNFISITPNPEKDQDEKSKTTNPDFDFLSSNNNTMNNNIITNQTMLTADELFFEGKLLPFWNIQHSENFNKMTLKTSEPHEDHHQVHETTDQEDTIMNTDTIKEQQQESKTVPNWFVDDDPSPRPPKCTVLWKELLKLKKQRNNMSSSSSSSLSPSSSSSSTSSSSSSLADIATKEERSNKEKQQVKKIRKGLERTRSGSIRIRPMIHVPICSAQVKTATVLPPIFPLKKGK